MEITPILLKDGYKVGHIFQYPSDTIEVYSNLTPRNSRRGDDSLGGVVFFGLNYFIKEYLLDQFEKNFFGKSRDEIERLYKRRIDNYLGPDAITIDHILALHDLGFLPLKIKALPEGTFVPYGVPVLTIRNTEPAFFWLTNMLETLMSSVLWKASTSATTALAFRLEFEKWAERTGASKEFIPWQGHDFSFRGMCGVEDAAVSGAAHLLSFTGTDTIPAIDFLEQYYNADSDFELIGGSVAATEHSVMCMTSPDGELATFERLVTEVYPNGIVSVVSDTWDLWRVLTEYLPAIKDKVLARDGKLVIRPDSGDPVKIVCGDDDPDFYLDPGEPAAIGVVELLWNIFGGTVNEKGYKELDPHVGVIYGDSINLDRQRRILSGLAAKGFASSNIVLGMGSFTYQYVTRDTDGWAVKATRGVTHSRGHVDIFKDPITDNGLKKSATGLLCVVEDPATGLPSLEQAVSEQRETEGLLKNVFIDGDLLVDPTLAEIRARVAERLT
jgi:nicotinamide phosphoribosyltransferase